jgi:hypothetical protein
MTCQIVVEGFHALVAPPDELELAPVVIDVTGLAVLIVRSRMQSGAGSDPARELEVTAQAALRIDAFLRTVALEAVAATFQIGVRRAQITGGQLRKPGRREQQAENQPQ